MKKIAQVIVNNSSKNLDKPFDYIIPDKYLNSIKIGTRVMVPFGKGNHKIEGYVINIKQEEPLFELKQISKLIDSLPVFNEDLLNLAYWMRNEYLCTLLDCIKCIAPTGIGIKTSKILILNNEFNIDKIKSKTQKNIINILEENNNQLELNQLTRITNKSCLSSIKKLSELGIIRIENKIESTVKDKIVKFAGLSISEEEAQIFVKDLNNKNNAQKRIINILLDNKYIAVSDLAVLADVSYSAINALHKKSLITIEEIEVYRDSYCNSKYKTTKALTPNNEQEQALSEIKKSIEGNQAEKFLIHGITGSGKTEVYLQAIDFVLKNDGDAIVLVPEISLTPQMVERFKSRFGDKVAVIHSKLSLGERYDQWKRIKNRQVNIVVGARSAIFAPFDNLKLIIIDEEHESSYKSESKPKYSAKEIALKRSQIEKCTVALGSATPSIETYYESKNSKFKLIEIKNRVNNSTLPQIEIIDLREEFESGNRSIFSKRLYEEISNNIKNNEQTILFLNRRGYSTFVSCRTCGAVLKCPNCNISLTYHSFSDMLICHYCGFERRNVKSCPCCYSKYIKYFGIGTQKIEEEIKKLFPHASVLRMDFDTTGTKFSHQKILDTFKNENINILIGTQMIAKGLDFPNVTLVGVVSADTTLNIDDYRAGERTFQLITQVAGRAGRGEKDGRVIVQTYQPENYSIITAKTHNYIEFYQNEISIRKNLCYPPFCDIITIIISHNNNDDAKKFAQECENMVSKKIKMYDFKSEFIMLKPTSAPISKIKNMYRWRIVIKTKSNEVIRNILREVELYFYEKTNINIDINGINML